MTDRTVSHGIDTLPVLGAVDRARLAQMAAGPDAEIDTSDIAELSGADMARAERGKFYRPLKAQITAKVDRDVLAWLKSDGRGYQSRLNAILRREMLKALGSEASHK